MWYGWRWRDVHARGAGAVFAAGAGAAYDAAGAGATYSREALAQFSQLELAPRMMRLLGAPACKGNSSRLSRLRREEWTTWKFEGRATSRPKHGVLSSLKFSFS